MILNFFSRNFVSSIAHSSSTNCIFITIHQPLFHTCITIPVESAPFFINSVLTAWFCRRLLPVCQSTSKNRQRQYGKHVQQNSSSEFKCKSSLKDFPGKVVMPPSLLSSQLRIGLHASHTSPRMPPTFSPAQTVNQYQPVNTQTYIYRQTHIQTWVITLLISGVSKYSNYTTYIKFNNKTYSTRQIINWS